MAQVTISDELADLIGTPRGTDYSDAHGAFVGQHVYVVVEDGAVKVVVDPLDRAIPAQYQARKYHHPIKAAAGQTAAVTAAQNALFTDALALAKAVGG